MSDDRHDDGSITTLLRAVKAGAKDAYGLLWAKIYDAARRIAHNRFRREPQGQVLQPTALVHEVYLELLGNEHLPTDNRTELWKLLTRVMSNYLCDEARRRLAVKRGGNLTRVELPDNVEAPGADLELVIAAHEVLERLESDHPRAASAYRLSELAGFKDVEVGHMLGVSERTVRNDLAFARALIGVARGGSNGREGTTR